MSSRVDIITAKTKQLKAFITTTFQKANPTASLILITRSQRRHRAQETVHSTELNTFRKNTLALT